MPFIAAAFVWQGYLNDTTGWMNRILGRFGIDGPDWLSSPTWALPALALIATWGIGNAIIIYMASLRSVPLDLYEAARLDGAGPWKVFRHVTWPLISPVTFYNVVIALVALGQYFIVPYVLTDGNGDPNGATLFYTMYLYRQTFTFSQGGYGSAMAWAMAIVIMSAAAALFWTSRHWVHYQYERRGMTAVTATTPTRRWSSKPRGGFGDLDSRTRRFITGATVTLFATLLVVTYLLPLAYGATSALKSEDQMSDPRQPILPKSPATVEIDGEEVPVLDVPIDGETRALALVDPGRESSVFVDPAEPDVPIEWVGRWRTLEPQYTLDPNWDNFRIVADTLDLRLLLVNTAIIAGLGMAGTVISSVLVAYGLSRFRIPGEKLIMASLIAAIILPRFVTIVPAYAVYQYLGWIGTWLPLIVPHFFANAYNVFLLRQFFMTIPRELDEAASIDGAGPLRTLMTIIVPQARAAIVAVALFHFFFAWNDFFEPLVYLSGQADKYPISIGLYSFLGLYKAQPALVQAAAMIAMVIPLLVFLFGQRFFVRGVDVSGALK